MKKDAHWIIQEYFDKDNFTITWYDRALRNETDKIDVGDQFMSLWVCFNSIIRAEFGENISDGDLIKEAKKDTRFKLCFNAVFNTTKFKEQFNILKTYKIKNMKSPTDTTKMKQIVNDTWEETIDVLYSVRCNLFHGRKEVKDIDFTIIKSAYNVLLPIVEEYLSKYLVIK